MARVGPVNGGVTKGTIPEVPSDLPLFVKKRGVGMALEAKAPDLLVRQEMTIGGAMRLMADGASLHVDRQMLEDPRSPLFTVTVEADLVASLSQLKAVGTAVGGVTVGAIDRPLGDPMVLRQGELGLDGSMAGIAEIG